MFNYLTPIIYWTLAAIWLVILWSCAKRLSQRDLQDNFFTTTLVILSIDALRTLLESLFFGLYRSSALGILPKHIYEILSHPGLVFIPKLINLIGAAAIVLLLRWKLLPQEKEEQSKKQRLIKEEKNRARQQEKAALALRESENQFRNIVEATPMGIHMYEIDDQGELILTGANPAADAILGIDHEALIGKSILEAFPALEYTEIPDRYKDACLLGRSWWTEDVTYQDGAISGAFDITAFRTHPGCMVAQFMDITKRKQADQNLEDLNRNLEKLVEERTRDLQDKADELETAKARMEDVGQLKSALLTSVSHELKTPLTSIIGYAKLMNRDYSRDIMPLVSKDASIAQSGQRVWDNLKVISQESARLLKLIDNFLAMARIRSSDDNVTMQTVAPETIIKRSVGLTRSSFTAKPDITLEMCIEDNLPDIHCDPDNLVQLVSNLLDNAAKFADTGTVTLSCSMAGDNRIRITVTDAGPGIPENEQAKVFDAFHQVYDDADCTYKPTGMGTGLTICKHIAQSHGGSIELECPDSGGCTFLVTLPVDPRQETN